ncbi:hypothetical protein FRB94_007303 [Tulasnella sp. JGI-2019a]|nr:hypothetical protein FRB94_007303 [Tulasnella sp. JGI-2019a]KAG9013293.1 hypothetical protein FRB93_000816 [Tulasnella sp. JGI-2019a]KAG9024216.1 hypothetical protein FRB95_011943 [Tulasnella sp. JGI-2019a]
MTRRDSNVVTRDWGRATAQSMNILEIAQEEAATEETQPEVFFTSSWLRTRRAIIRWPTRARNFDDTGSRVVGNMTLSISALAGFENVSICGGYDG